jgi:LysM repeat protein/5'(3')-deoxyribonucleotidase
MKNSIDANITAGALYFKMQKDRYGAEDTQQQLAMYNGGPGAKKGNNKGANDYATSVQSYSSKIADIVKEPQPQSATSSKNVPFRSPLPKKRPANLVPDVDIGDAYDDDFRTKDDIKPAPLPKKKLTYIDLAKMNKIADVNKISIGQKLKMPDGSTYSVKSGDTLSGIAKLHNRATVTEEDVWNDIFELSEATSSPGRVKRAGASCKGSVTELRALAKKHSGTEKGKMYHWCANMKGGKKESIQEVLSDITSSTKVFVDMDGVLADFFGEWNKLIGKSWRNVTDIEPELQKIRDTEDFWLDLPMLPKAKNLLGMIKDLKGSYNILSSPLPDDPNSEPHKRQWIEKYLSFFPPEKVIITHNKTPYAINSDGSPNILIDDFGPNVNKWEAAGGVGFKHKDHKFERTAKAIQQHMSDPAK